MEEKKLIDLPPKFDYDPRGRDDFRHEPVTKPAGEQVMSERATLHGAGWLAEKMSALIAVTLDEERSKLLEDDEEDKTPAIPSFTLEEYENVGMGLQEVNEVQIILEDGQLKIRGRQFNAGVWDHLSITSHPNDTLDLLKGLKAFAERAIKELGDVRG